MFTQKEYKKFVDDAGGKYHYVITNKTKSIILSSSNSKNEARQEALQKLQPMMDAVLGKYIYLLKITVRRKDFIEEQQEKNKKMMKFLGGPIEFKIDKVQVVSPTRLKNTGGMAGVSRAFISDKYLDKYKKLDERTILDFPIKFLNKLTNNDNILWDINIYNDIYFTEVEDKVKKKEKEETKLQEAIKKQEEKNKVIRMKTFNSKTNKEHKPVKDIIDETDKYYIVATNKKFRGILSSSGRKGYATSEALDKIENMRNKDDFYFYLVKIKNNDNKELPINLTIEKLDYYYKNYEEKMQLKTIGATDENNIIYLTKDYLNIYNTITPETIKDFVFNYHNNKLNNNIISD